MLSNDTCWLGFCYDNHKYQRHHQYRTSIGSFLFFTVVGYIASFFSLWPETFGNPPTGILNIIYRAWLGVLLYNFSERLIWYPLYEAVSFGLEYISYFLQWLNYQLGSQACDACFDSLKGDCFHQLVLTFITAYVLFAFLHYKRCFPSVQGFMNLFRKQGNDCNGCTQRPRLITCLRISRSISNTELNPEPDYT